MNGILGIVSEYNPFHNGHLHHLELSKQLTNTDFTVAVMSGNFVQRGDAIDIKYRAESLVEQQQIHKAVIVFKMRFFVLGDI